MAAYDWGKGLVKGLVWGGLIGVFIGILYSKKRDKTWEDIGKSADELVDKTKEQVVQARRKLEKLANRRKASSTEEMESLQVTGAPQG